MPLTTIHLQIDIPSDDGYVFHKLDLWKNNSDWKN